MLAKAPSVASPEPLRDGKRAFTQARICAAAREVFATQGFAQASMEQIAQAAGAQCSTLYNHFRGKNEILAAIARDLAAKLVPVIQMLPGSEPARAQIDACLKQIVNVATTERAPTVLLQQLGGAFEVPLAVQEIGTEFMAAFAERHPAFARALVPGPEQDLDRAHAVVVLRQIGLACIYHIRSSEAGSTAAMLKVTGDMLERFLGGAPSVQGSLR